MQLPDDVNVQWLLAGDPRIEYRIRLDLLNQDEHNPEVAAARAKMLDHSQIKNLVGELSNWPGAVLKSHKDANHPIHKLAFLADLGLKADDPGMDIIVHKILSHQSKEGPLQVLTNNDPINSKFFNGSKFNPIRYDPFSKINLNK